MGQCVISWTYHPYSTLAPDNTHFHHLLPTHLCLLQLMLTFLNFTNSNSPPPQMPSQCPLLLRPPPMVGERPKPLRSCQQPSSLPHPPPDLHHWFGEIQVTDRMLAAFIFSLPSFMLCLWTSSPLPLPISGPPYPLDLLISDPHSTYHNTHLFTI